MAFADDYVPVAERIAEFRAAYPNGSLRPADPARPYTIERIPDGKGEPVTYIVVVAAAYRTPDDPCPGIGMAYEVFPGKTNFTRGSELQNAETSAWGRAIVASLAGDTRRGIASAEEIRNRQADEDAWQSRQSRPATRPAAPPKAPARTPEQDQAKRETAGMVRGANVDTTVWEVPPMPTAEDVLALADLDQLRAMWQTVAKHNLLDTHMQVPDAEAALLGMDGPESVWRGFLTDVVAFVTANQVSVLAVARGE